jgi:hypothetical protein
MRPLYAVPWTHVSLQIFWNTLATVLACRAEQISLSVRSRQCLRWYFGAIGAKHRLEGFLSLLLLPQLSLLSLLITNFSPGLSISVQGT